MANSNRAVQPLQFINVSEPHGQKRKYVKETEWAPLKTFILQKKDAKFKLKEIVDALRVEQGFETDVKSLKNILIKWEKTGKNLSRKEQRYLNRIANERAGMGKQTACTFGVGGELVRGPVLDRIMNLPSETFKDTVADSPGRLVLVATPINLTESTETTTIARSSQSSVSPPEARKTLATDLHRAEGIDRSLFDKQYVNTSQTSNLSGPSDKTSENSILEHDEDEASQWHANLSSEKQEGIHAALRDNQSLEENCERLTNLLRQVSKNPIGNRAQPSTSNELGSEYLDQLVAWIRTEQADGNLLCAKIRDRMETHGESLQTAYNVEASEWSSCHFAFKQPLPYHIYQTLLEVDLSVVTSSLPQSTEYNIHGQDKGWESMLSAHKKHYSGMNLWFRATYRDFEQDDDPYISEIAFGACSAHLSRLFRTCGPKHFLTLFAGLEFMRDAYRYGYEISDDVFVHALQIFYDLRTMIGIWNDCPHERLLRSMPLLFSGYYDRGQRADAAEIGKIMLRGFLSLYGPKHPETLRALLLVSDLIVEGGLIGYYSSQDVITLLEREFNGILDWPINLTSEQLFIQIRMCQRIGSLFRKFKLNQKAVDIDKFVLKTSSRLLKTSDQVGDLFTPEDAAIFIGISLDDLSLSQSDSGNLSNAIQYLLAAMEFYLSSPHDPYSQLMIATDMSRISVLMGERGLVFYSVPMIEATLELFKDTEEEDSDRIFKLWLQYACGVFQLRGQGRELEDIQQRLLPGYLQTCCVVAKGS